MIKPTTLLIGLHLTGAALALNSENANAQVTYELGIGAMYGPKYEGSDSLEFTPIPQLSMDVNDGMFFASLFGGVGTYFVREKDFKIGASIDWEFGREEDDDTMLSGLGDIDTKLIGKLLAEYSLGPVQISGEIAKGDSEYGTTAKIEVGTMFPVSERMMMMSSVGVKWADQNHLQTYFGITDNQAGSSMYRPYTPNSGIKAVTLSAGAIYQLDSHWDVMLMGSVDKLTGGAKGSPITKDEYQPNVFITTSYKF